MKERGILFTKENRLASVEGRKTQTRRIMNPQPKYRPYLQKDAFYIPKFGYIAVSNTSALKAHMKARHQVGDHLYMKEPYQVTKYYPGSYRLVGTYLDDGKPFEIHLSVGEYRKFNVPLRPKMKTSSRFMYKSLARYWFEVTGVRVERVQDITPEDCEAEGITWYGGHGGGTHYNNTTFYVAFPNKPGGFTTAKEAFECLWDSINEKRGHGWDKNDYVWVYEYKRIEVVVK